MGSSIWAADDVYVFVKAKAYDLNATLPDHISNAGLVSVIEYGSALATLSYYIDKLENVIENCNWTQQLLSIEKGVNFGRNCNITGDFWGPHVLPQDYDGLPNLGDLVKLFFLKSYSAMNDNTFEVAGLVMTNFDKGSKDVFRDPLQMMLIEAAGQCAPAACCGLNYSGSPDIAGIGVSAILLFSRVSSLFLILYSGLRCICIYHSSSYASGSYQLLLRGDVKVAAPQPRRT